MLLEVQCEVSTVSDDLGCHVICWCQGRKFHLTVGGDNIHKISQEQFLNGTQIIQLKLYL